MANGAVVLLSGGIDSSTAMAIAGDTGFDLYAMSFNYGQRNRFELESARKIARLLHAREHLIMDIDLSAFRGSALTGNIPVPKGARDNQPIPGIPVTYVPARNTIFLSLALGWAETLNCSHIFIGVNALDYSGYPDCRPEFIETFEKLANLATKAGVEGCRFTIHAPLIGLRKAQIIRQGIELGLDYSLTNSCYDPAQDGRACGICDSCVLRKKGFQAAGAPDPTPYADKESF